MCDGEGGDVPAGAVQVMLQPCLPLTQALLLPAPCPSSSKPVRASSCTWPVPIASPIRLPSPTQPSATSSHGLASALHACPPTPSPPLHRWPSMQAAPSSGLTPRSCPTSQSCGGCRCTVGSTWRAHRGSNAPKALPRNIAPSCCCACGHGRGCGYHCTRG